MNARTLAIAVAGMLAAAPAAAAQSDVQNPPKLPNTARSAKKCGVATAARSGASYRVYVTKGKSLITCRKARAVIRGFDFLRERTRGWTYFDWTKGGNGPWSDVWEREDTRVVIGAVLRM
jgi:uncharacterized protein YcaQ